MVIELSKVRGIFILRDKQCWKLDFLTLKKKGQRIFDMSVTIYQSTQRNISEDLYLQQRHWELFKYRKTRNTHRILAKISKERNNLQYNKVHQEA
jgi:hypothetical protein